MKLPYKIIIGAVIFICAFVYFTPASIIQKFLPGNVTTAGISGTVWKGNAQTIVVDKIGIRECYFDEVCADRAGQYGRPDGFSSVEESARL